VAATSERAAAAPAHGDATTADAGARAPGGRTAYVAKSDDVTVVVVVGRSGRGDAGAAGVPPPPLARLGGSGGSDKTG